MSTSFISCPKCHHQFDASESLKEEYKQKMLEWKRQKEQELQQQLIEKEKQINHALLQQQAQKMQQERQAWEQEKAREQKMLADQLSTAQHQVQQLQKKELEAMQLQNQLEDMKRSWEVEKEKYLLANKQQLVENALREEKERNELRIKEYELQMEQQKKLIAEMKRKAEQGSMQLQGEAQELILESLLSQTFPFDVIKEVGKGVRGADCTQEVRNTLGQICGSIIFESKRTQAFSNEWIEKLKADMRAQGADIAVLVTQVMPKDMTGFGLKDGVYVCTFTEVRAVAGLLREQIIKVHAANKNQENKGDKMVMLYDYLTSNEFSEQWKAISEGFRAMKNSIQKERDTMEKLWKLREKQLEKVLLNAAHIKGSVEGIAGTDAIQLDFDAEDTLLLD